MVWKIMMTLKPFTPILIFPRRSLNRPPNDEVVLGVDPGLATTGWGVVSKAGVHLTLRAYGAIISPARNALPDRLHQIRKDLSRIMDLHQPIVLAIEELYFAKFAVSIAATAQARGVILLTAAERGVPVVEYNPRTVK